MTGEKRPKILIVDDEPDVTSYCQSYFGRRGYMVSTTASGIDALSMIKTLKPDLVILDRKIADMSGDEILKAVREFDKDLKVVILTGYSLNSEEEKEKFYRLGISAYIEKPVVLYQLEGVVAELVGSGLVFEGTENPRKVGESVKSLRSIVHEIKNILGNTRSECEVFLLNKNDGLYNTKSKEDLEKISDKIIADVIESVDRAVKVVNDIREDGT